MSNLVLEILIFVSRMLYCFQFQHFDHGDFDSSQAQFTPINFAGSIVSKLFIPSNDTMRNVSVNSKPDHPPPPGKPQGNFLERAKSLPRAQRKCETSPLMQKNCAETPPPGQFFQTSSKKNTKHETEIMKN